jgi:hypothetical protein
MPSDYEMERVPSESRELYRCKACLKVFDPTPPMFHSCMTPEDWHNQMATATQEEYEELKRNAN